MRSRRVRNIFTLLSRARKRDPIFYTKCGYAAQRLNVKRYPKFYGHGPGAVEDPVNRTLADGVAQIRSMAEPDEYPESQTAFTGSGIGDKHRCARRDLGRLSEVTQDDSGAASAAYRIIVW